MGTNHIDESILHHDDDKNFLEAVLLKDKAVHPNNDTDTDTDTDKDKNSEIAANKSVCLPFYQSWTLQTHEKVSLLFQKCNAMSAFELIKKSLPYFPQKLLDDLEKAMAQVDDAIRAVQKEEEEGQVKIVAARAQVEDAKRAVQKEEEEGQVKITAARAQVEEAESAISENTNTTTASLVASPDKKKTKFSSKDESIQIMELRAALALANAVAETNGVKLKAALAFSKCKEVEKDHFETLNQHKDVLARAEKALSKALDEKNRILNQHKDVLARAEKALSNRKDALWSAFDKIKSNVLNIHGSLNEVARYSQAESSMLASASYNRISSATAEQVKNEAVKFNGRNTGQPSEYVTKLFKNIQSLDTTIFNPAATTYSKKQKMSIVAKTYNEWINNAIILIGIKTKKKEGHSDQFVKSKEEYAEKIRSSAEWYKNRVQEKLRNGRMEDVITTKLYFPGAVGFEVQGCQIVVSALIESIARCLYSDIPSPDIDAQEQAQEQKQGFSPHKTRITRETVILGGPENIRHMRKVDIVLSKEGQAFLLMHDENMKLTIELMPLVRKDKAFESLLAEKRDQAVGHMAKSIASSFNLLGVGTSGKATALSGCFCFLKVHHMKLRMGEDIKEGDVTYPELEFQESGVLPLMSEGCYKKILGKSKITLSEKQMSALHEDLSEAFPGDDDVPHGIRLLFELMQKRKHDLLGYNIENLQVEPKKKSVLGTGTFGIILGNTTSKVRTCNGDSIKNGDGACQNIIWKLSLFSHCDHLLREREALKALEPHGTFDDRENRNEKNGIENEELGCKHLPRLVDNSMSKFPLKLGRIKMSVPCLQLTPRGIPVLSLKLDTEDVIKASQHVFLGMAFLHAKGFIHCDISPKNIVRDMHCNYVLVDLGLATKTGEELTGFQGTVSYAATTVFCKYPNVNWKPTACTDTESLRYTMAALLNGGIPKWDMSPFPRSLNNDTYIKSLLKGVIDKRQSAVVKLFDDSHVKWECHQLEKSDSSNQTKENP